MNTLLEQIQTESTQARADAHRLYPELLARNDPADKAAMAEVMRTLNISESQLMSDVAAVTAAKEWRRRIATPERLASLGDAVQKIIRQIDEEREAWSRREQELKQQSLQASFAYDNVHRTNQQAEDELDRLLRSHPLAFGLTEAPADPEPVQARPPSITYAPEAEAKPAPLEPYQANGVMERRPRFAGLSFTRAG